MFISPASSVRHGRQIYYIPASITSSNLERMMKRRLPAADRPSSSYVPTDGKRKGKTDEKSSQKQKGEDKTRIIDDVKTALDAKTSWLTTSIYHSKSFVPITIYKVPEKLWKSHGDSFIPRIVSIGPHHKGNSSLQLMDVFKVRCLERFNTKYEDASIHILTEMVEREEKMRNCYEKSLSHLKSKDFIEMMMLDGIFIVELLSDVYTGADAPIRRGESNTSDGKIFEQKWMTDEILHDMLLLENQLPWFVISICLRHAKKKITHHISGEGEGEGEGTVKMHLDMVCDHLTALKVYFQRAGIICDPQVILGQTIYSHYLEHLWTSIQPKGRPRRPRRRGKPEFTRTATELREAGVQFKKGGGEDTTKTLTDIEFDFHTGTLTIPTLSVNEWTETFFRNLIALEQIHSGGKPKIVTSYIIFLDYLIDTGADVKLLVKRGIIENSLGDSDRVAQLFNNLHKETLQENKGFYYAKHCEELNEYSRDFVRQSFAKCQKWKRMLLSDDYFGNPLAATAIFVAFALLALTVIQTYCSVKGLKN